MSGKFSLGDDQRAVQVNRYFQDAKVPQIIEGTNQIQRNVIARAMLGSTKRK